MLASSFDSKQNFVGLLLILIVILVLKNDLGE